MVKTTLGLLAVTILAWGQTLVDLKTQAKRVDFANATSTRPFRTGSVLPATCAVGEMFFNTGAPTGQNIYACTSTNLWSIETGTGTGGGTNLPPTAQHAGSVLATDGTTLFWSPAPPANTTIRSSGVLIGARGTLDYSSGSGSILSLTDTGQAIGIEQTIDTAVVETRANSQAGASVLCLSADASTVNYTCSLDPALLHYTMGMVLHWIPNQSNTGAATLNVDLLGAVVLKLPDGFTDPAPGDIVGGQAYDVWYDGSKFRLMLSKSLSGVDSSIPRTTCNGSLRGRLWYVSAGNGTKDELSICAKDATDTYAWRTLY